MAFHTDLGLDGTTSLVALLAFNVGIELAWILDRRPARRPASEPVDEQPPAQQPLAVDSH